jgi:hypothetical protein
VCSGSLSSGILSLDEEKKIYFSSREKSGWKGEREKNEKRGYEITNEIIEDLVPTGVHNELCCSHPSSTLRLLPLSSFSNIPSKTANSKIATKRKRVF